jgi:serine-type D-Ala-D-Ala endopeptidase (penicillin-binding protein 7)
MTLRISGILLALIVLVSATALACAGAKAKPAKPAMTGVREVTKVKRPLACRASMPCAARLALLRSSAVLVLEPRSGRVLFEKNAGMKQPIASITKLMTALVVVRSRQALAETLTVADADVDRLKYSSSRLRVGTRLTRRAMLHIALMSSENRAASALARAFPGGTPAFVKAMNATARELGMMQTHFVEATGLSRHNVSTPSDLAKLVIAAQRHALIRRYSTDATHTIRQGRLTTVYRNSNRLIGNAQWKIGLQKTGYIAEAGRCMVLHAQLRGRPVVMVFLDAQGKFARARDANQVRAWLVAKRRARRR